ncbi:MAG: hypothetical protein JWP65_3146 [Ramlibacter sp.]|uniref:hypothetical protein n=1 Tax=Ramlibacter sp. TaxID=1917967 RepID=UPI00260AFF4D|nr:hypothetical protein [Ramlibacter sp.]MDB5752725.1 hypothetical protein [Ramlibacter sp.]
MKVSPHPAVATSPTFAPGRCGAGDDWLRQLQVAHRLAWFHGPDGAATSVPLADGRRHAWLQSQDAGGHRTLPEPTVAAAARGGAGANPWRAPQSAAAVASAFAVGEPASLARATAVSRAGFAPSAAAAAQSAGSLGAGMPWTASTVRPMPPAATRIVCTRPPDILQPGSPRTPVRVHVEEGPLGVAVYLGIDGPVGAPAVRSAALATELRRQLSATGLRLASVVCNGTVLEPHSHFHQEP